jgi:isopenicillin N synthase-like dioxygenase
MFATEVVALQVLDNVDQKTWRYVKPVPGALVCNIGDTLQFISGGLLKSTVHRVTRPPLPSQQSMHRFNLLYFLRADDSVVLKPPPSRYIPASAAKIEGMGLTAGEWVLARVKAAVRRREYDGKNQDAEAKAEYNRLQRISNSVVGREIEDSFQVGKL